jgi:hypothetical protein
MTQSFFLAQMSRLRMRFGGKSFDGEIVKLLSREVAKLPESFFLTIIDTWIGTRKTSNPPLLTEFREARLAFEKGNLAKECIEASKGFQNGLKAVLRQNYNVDTLQEAFELEKLKLQLQEGSK